MGILKFEEVIAWQKAKYLCTQVYLETQSIKDFGFNSQIQRAAVSIMNNIAEGFERRSNNEFRQFLYIAKGSCGETKSMLILAADLNYIKDSRVKELIAITEEISKMLNGLIKTLSN